MDIELNVARGIDHEAACNGRPHALNCLVCVHTSPCDLDEARADDQSAVGAALQAIGAREAQTHARGVDSGCDVNVVARVTTVDVRDSVDAAGYLADGDLHVEGCVDGACAGSTAEVAVTSRNRTAG